MASGRANDRGPGAFRRLKERFAGPSWQVRQVVRLKAQTLKFKAAPGGSTVRGKVVHTEPGKSTGS